MRVVLTMHRPAREVFNHADDYGGGKVGQRIRDDCDQQSQCTRVSAPLSAILNEFHANVPTTMNITPDQCASGIFLNQAWQNRMKRQQKPQQQYRAIRVRPPDFTLIIDCPPRATAHTTEETCDRICHTLGDTFWLCTTVCRRSPTV
jgi:hypothetical protein